MMASQQSMNPSRCRKPLSAKGTKAMRKEIKKNGVPIHTKNTHNTAHKTPMMSPMAGKNPNMAFFISPSHFFAGHGKARKFPHAIKNPVKSFIQSPLFI